MQQLSEPTVKQGVEKAAVVESVPVNLEEMQR